MLLIRLRFIFLAVICGLSVSVNAERVKDLYQYSVLVGSQGSSEYDQALVDGLAEVIVRSSGDIQVLQDRGIRDAMGRASRFLLQYHYDNTNEVIEIDGRQVDARELVLEFSGEAIENLLRDLELPLWPSNRRNVLVWMVADDAQERRVVSEVNFPEADEALIDSFTRRGLPMVRQLMDLDDQVALSPNQLWTMSLEDIRRASERYAPDSILAGRLSQTSRGDWRSDWQLMVGGDTAIFDSQGFSVEEAIAGGVDQVANYFFERESINPLQDSAREVLLFQVDGINDFSHYIDVLNYIEQLTLVRRADLLAVREDSLLLYLYTDGSVTLLQNTLDLDGKLLPRNRSDNRSPLGSAENPLLYAWRPKR